MKKLFYLAIVMLSFSCGGNSDKAKTEDKPNVDEFSSIAQSMKDEHNAKLSLDYQGTYKGVLPTASGEGMDVTIVLTDDTFTKTTAYIGKKNSTIVEKGSYEWNEAGNTITLKGLEAPNQYFVGENTLTSLDISGNKITGSLADKYVLTKE